MYDLVSMCLITDIVWKYWHAILIRIREFTLNYYKQFFLDHSITGNYRLICFIESSLMEPQLKYNPISSFFNCLFYRKLVNTLTPTLFQSKSFSFRVPTSQSPASNVNLAIRPKKIISSMLVLIPVINENKWYVICLCSSFPLAYWTQWSTVI